MANENKFRRLQCEQGAKALILEETGFYYDDGEIHNDYVVNFNGNTVFLDYVGFLGEVDFSDATITGLSTGTKLYKHHFYLIPFDEGEEVFDTTKRLECYVISSKSTAFVRSDFEDGTIETRFISICGKGQDDIGDDEWELNGNYIINIAIGDQDAYANPIIHLLMATSYGTTLSLDAYGFSGTLADEVSAL